jgi:hypothetical protein
VRSSHLCVLARAIAALIPFRGCPECRGCSLVFREVYYPLTALMGMRIRTRKRDHPPPPSPGQDQGAAAREREGHVHWKTWVRAGDDQIICSGGIPFPVSGLIHVLCNSPIQVPCKSGKRTSQPLNQLLRHSHCVKANEIITKIVTTSGNFLTASQLIASGVPVARRTSNQPFRPQFRQSRDAAEQKLSKGRKAPKAT